MHDAREDGHLVSGRYRLRAPIGRGAMGIVWRARDELLDREVAIKEVRAAGLTTAAESEGIYRRTLREAKAAARLNHPGVVTVFDVVEEDGSPWIVMELVPARSLDRVIVEDGPLPPLPAARLGEHLLSALACAHAGGVLHRDVKPGNVLLGPDDRTVLTDFGIATFEGDPALTQAGMVFGTPGFTAPERIRGDSASPASDLWSLGATLYTAVEGRGPFERPGGSAAITAAVIGEDPPRAPSAGPLAAVIDALLRADPDQRPDAAAAARLLAGAAAEAESGTTYPGAIPVADGAPPFGDVRAFPDPGAPAFPGPAAPAFPGPAAPAFPGPAAPAFPGPAAPAFPGPGAPAFPGPAAPAFPGPGTPAFPGPPAFQEPSTVMDPSSLMNAPVFTDRPACPGQPAFMDQPALADQPAFADLVRTADPPWLPPAARLGAAGPLAAGPMAPKPAAGGSSAGGSSAGGPGPRPRPRGGRRARVAAFAGAAVAVVIAAAGLVAWSAQSRSVDAATPPETTAGAAPAQATRAHAAPADGQDARPGAPAAGHAAGGAADPGYPTGTAANAGQTASAGGTSALPAGYRWFGVTAADSGTVAGFEIAAPASWLLTTQGLTDYLRPPAGSAYIEISLAPFAHPRPVPEALSLQAQALAQDRYPGYRLFAITAGTVKGDGEVGWAPDAAWRFSWEQAGVGRVGVLELLVQVSTTAGMQPYALAVSAPSVEFPAADAVFRRTLQTFRPLP